MDELDPNQTPSSFSETLALNPNHPNFSTLFGHSVINLHFFSSGIFKKNSSAQTTPPGQAPSGL